MTAARDPALKLKDAPDSSIANDGPAGCIYRTWRLLVEQQKKPQALPHHPSDETTSATIRAFLRAKGFPGEMAVTPGDIKNLPAELPASPVRLAAAD